MVMPMGAGIHFPLPSVVFMGISCLHSGHSSGSYVANGSETRHERCAIPRLDSVMVPRLQSAATPTTVPPDSLTACIVLRVAAPVVMTSSTTSVRLSLMRESYPRDKMNSSPCFSA